MRLYRVKVVRDKDAVFEECNGEARPLTETEYQENQYRSCPQHMRAGSKVISFGPPQVQGCAECGNTNYEDIPYSEYLAYYGNPAMHAYLGVIVETLDAPIGDWKHETGLWGIDTMRDNEEAEFRYRNTWMTPEDALALPGYLAEVVREQLDEAGYPA